MWTELPTVESTADCRPPYSFFFNLVGTHWKTASANSVPLHRICTLARKQGAATVIVESAFTNAAVREEVEALDQAYGGGGAAEACAISFFAGTETFTSIDEVAEGQFLGQAILINYRPPGLTEFQHSYIFEAALRTPALVDPAGQAIGLLNNFVCVDHEFERTVHGRSFKVKGIYYCQQNSNTHVCAHASLKMALTTESNNSVTSPYINGLLGISPPCSGLSLQNIADVIKDQGLHPGIVDCKDLEYEDYISILASIVESGDMALLVFTTGSSDDADAPPTEHVVVVYGHTRHSDEWHPQAIPAYSGPSSAQYYSASNWIDHFLIHDDNFGPYYTLSSRAFEFQSTVKVHWIISVRKSEANLPAHLAEAIAAVQLANLLPSLAPMGTGRWFEYITQQQRQFVLRSILVNRADYIEHLESSVAHDGSTITQVALDRLGALVDRFWLVEFSLPELFTGNHSKLGEVVIAANVEPNVSLVDQPLTLAIRMPDVLLIRNLVENTLESVPSGVEAHLPILRLRPHGPIW